MTPVARVLLLGSAAVLVFDTAASLVSIFSGLDYGTFGIGSNLIYAAAGFAAARVRNAILTGALAGGAVGLVDATLGWSISALLGPGRPPADLGQSTFLIAGVMIFVVLQAAAIGLAGGLAGKWVSSRRRPGERRARGSSRTWRP